MHRHGARWELFELGLKKVTKSVLLFTAGNGQHALQLLSTSVILPDVIFMDINMPVLNGFDTMKLLKKNNTFSNIPTVVYSTSASPEDISKATQLGAMQYVNKPNQFADLCIFLKPFVA